MSQTMPRFLRVMMIFAAVFSCITVVILALSFWGMIPYSIGGYASTREEWLRITAPLWALIGAWMAGIAYALWTRRAWARPLILIMWLVIGSYALAFYFTGNLQLEIMLSTVVRVVVFGAFCAWYLYRKANVVAYFAQL